VHGVRVGDGGGARRGGVDGGELLGGGGFASAVDVDDETVRIRQKEGRVLGDVVDVKNDAGDVGCGLRDTDALEKAFVGDGEGFADKVAGEMGAVEIEEDAVGRRDAGGFVLNLVAEIDGDAGVGGGGPVADAGDAGEWAGATGDLAWGRKGGRSHPLQVVVGGRR